MYGIVRFCLDFYILVNEILLEDFFVKIFKIFKFNIYLYSFIYVVFEFNICYIWFIIKILNYFR